MRTTPGIKPRAPGLSPQCSTTEPKLTKSPGLLNDIYEQTDGQMNTSDCLGQFCACAPWVIPSNLMGMVVDTISPGMLFFQMIWQEYDHSGNVVMFLDCICSWH